MWRATGGAFQLLRRWPRCGIVSGMPDTVLVIDDDALFRAMVTPALEARGLRVVTAGTGAAGTKAYEAEKPALVVVDGLLPDTKGVAWIDAFRRAGHTEPLLFVSAFWRDATTAAQLVKDHGVAQVLSKPINPEALASAVQSQLDKRRGPASEDLEEIIEIDEPADAALSRDDWERHLFRLDAARTLGQRMRSLSDAFSKAMQRLDVVQTADGRKRAEQLSSLAAASSFPEVASASARIAEALRVLGADRAATKASWVPVSMLLTEGLELARRTAQAQSAAGAPSLRLLVAHGDAAVRRHLRALLPRTLCELTLVSTLQEAVERAGQPGAASPPFHGALLSQEPGTRDAAASLRLLPGGNRLALGLIANHGQRAETAAVVRALDGRALVTLPLTREVVIAQVCQLLGVGVHPPMLKVVVLDDDQDLQEELSFQLARHGMEAACQGLGVSEDFVHAQRPSALIVNGGDPRGVATILTLRGSARWKDLPIVALSGANAAGRIAVLEAGADACLPRGSDLEEVMAVLEVRLDAAQRLKEREVHDGLTGVFGRRAYLEALAQRLGSVRRNQRTLSVAMLSLSGLPELNAAQGYLAVDHALRASGALLTERLRVEDLCGRWSPETFALALQDCRPDAAATVVRKLTEQLEGPSFAGRQGPFRLRIASGIASCPDDGSTLLELLAGALGKVRAG